MAVEWHEAAQLSVLERCELHLHICLLKLYRVFFELVSFFDRNIVNADFRASRLIGISEFQKLALATFWQVDDFFIVKFVDWCLLAELEGACIMSLTDQRHVVSVSVCR